MHRLKYSFREITKYFIKIKVMTERNFPPGKWYSKDYYWVLLHKSTSLLWTYIPTLHLFGFALFLSQRTKVFSRCNTRLGLPKSQCTRWDHPFCYHLPCLHHSSPLGAWDGAGAFKTDGNVCVSHTGKAQGAASAVPATIWWLHVQTMILWLPMFNFINLKVAPFII